MYFCFSSALIKWPLRFYNERSEGLSLLCNVLFQFCLLAETSLFNFSHWVLTFTVKNQGRYPAGQSQSQINGLAQCGLWLHSLKIEYTWTQKSCLRGSTALCVYLDTKVSRGKSNSCSPNGFLSCAAERRAMIISPLTVNCGNKSCLVIVPPWLIVGWFCVAITTNVFPPGAYKIKQYRSVQEELLSVEWSQDHANNKKRFSKLK